MLGIAYQFRDLEIGECFTKHYFLDTGRKAKWAQNEVKMWLRVAKKLGWVSNKRGTGSYCKIAEPNFRDAQERRDWLYKFLN
jgi:hypothetical protein